MQFRDLKKQYEALKSQIDEQISDVLKSAKFISGPQVQMLEERLADYVGVRHCITCANGTDAITLALMALGIGKNDAVFVPDFTFFSSGESPAYAGAIPVFIDVDECTYNINPDNLEEAVLSVKAEGRYVPKAVVAVDLFGLPADYGRIRQICDKYDLYLLEDGAQGFGGSINGKMACSFGDISTTSFFPAKPLGCYGDGGAVFTDNDKWAELIRSYSIHGKSGNDKYDNVRIGMNSRLDTLQAAILLAKLDAFISYELDDVNEAAVQYTAALKDTDLVLPIFNDGFVSSMAQYTVQLPDGTDRKNLKENLKARGIPTMVYYMKPMHLQGAFTGTYSAKSECMVTEKLCRTVLSLPMHPYLTKSDIDFVTENIKQLL